MHKWWTGRNFTVLWRKLPVWGRAVSIYFPIIFLGSTALHSQWKLSRVRQGKTSKLIPKGLQWSSGGLDPFGYHQEAAEDVGVYSEEDFGCRQEEPILLAEEVDFPQNLVVGLPTRFQEAIAREGGMTRYETDCKKKKYMFFSTFTLFYHCFFVRPVNTFRVHCNTSWFRSCHMVF